MSVPRTRLLAAALAAASALLLIPASGHAATTFGSRLRDNPNAGCSTTGTTCSLVSFIHPIDPNGDPYSGGAPVSGVITKFRVRGFGLSAPALATFRIADITRSDPDHALANATGTGPTVTLPADTGGGDAPITEAAARLPVRQGQHLGIDGTDIEVVHATDGSKFTYEFTPPLIDGSPPRDATAVTEELLVQAVIEPDADGDGFGDETQDGCPAQRSTQGACDTAAPSVSGLRVSGGKLAYRLSEAATVSFRLDKITKGRKVRGKCRTQTKKNRRRPSCTLFKTVKRNFNGPGNVGLNKVTLPKLHGRKLGSGKYRLTMTVTDAAGNAATSSKRFQIKAKRKRRRH